MGFGIVANVVAMVAVVIFEAVSHAVLVKLLLSVLRRLHNAVCQKEVQGTF